MAEERVDRRLAAIFAADVAGYSRLMGRDEEGTHAALSVIRFSTQKLSSTTVVSLSQPAMAPWSSLLVLLMLFAAR